MPTRAHSYTKTLKIFSLKHADGRKVKNRKSEIGVKGVETNVHAPNHLNECSGGTSAALGRPARGAAVAKVTVFYGHSGIESNTMK